MSAQPFLSIVIPTRDRPHLIKHALWSLQHQTDGDFEVIVCDNPTTRPSREVFDEYADSRFRYVRPPEPLGMVDNWNFALSHARGLYVTYLEDKFALRLDCVHRAKTLLQKQPAEVLNWYHDIFHPGGDATAPEGGVYYESIPQRLEPVHYDPKAVLSKRLSSEFVRGEEGGMYGALQILFGAYHEELIQRIVERTGRLFHPVSPDYTSMTAAALLARSALDAGSSGCVGIISPLSNGIQTSVDPERMLAFIGSVGDLDDLIQSCPVPGVYMSGNNFVCRDHLAICGMLPTEAAGIEANLVKLTEGFPAELKNVEWRSDAEKAQQLAAIDAAVSRFPWKQRVGYRVGQWSRRLAGPHAGSIARSLAPALRWASETLQPESMIPSGSELWDRWTDRTGYTPLAGTWTLREALTLFQLQKPGSPQQELEIVSSPPDQTTMTPHDETELESICKKLASENQRLYAEIEKASDALTKQKNDHREKVSNLKGMIGRRDARIEKLELRVEKKKGGNPG